MAFGELAKQLAVDALRPSEATQPNEAARPAEMLSATIVGQIQAMQKALKEDQELVVLFHAGTETIRVLECFLPSSQVAVLTGPDREKNMTRVVAPVESLQLICKVTKAPPGKAARISFKVPKP